MKRSRSCTSAPAAAARRRGRAGDAAGGAGGDGRRRRSSPISSDGSARSSTGAIRCRRRPLRWPACSGRGRSCTTMRAAPPIDHLNEPWAMTLPPIPLENGAIRGSIVDAQGASQRQRSGRDRPVSTSQRARIARLSRSAAVPPTAIDAIADWIDADGVTRPNGAEDAFYASLPVPGLAANAPSSASPSSARCAA